MKSGTNQLHGSGYDYFVNEALNAGTPFTNAGTINPAKEGQHIRNPIRQNDYGVTLGGPIDIPNLQRSRQDLFLFQLRAVPSKLLRRQLIWHRAHAAQRKGNFSAALRPTCNGPDPAGQRVCLNEIFDPTSNRTVNGAVVGLPFPTTRSRRA